MTYPASKILLGVNVDHCATVRQARFREHAMDHGNEVEPDPVLGIRVCGLDNFNISFIIL